MPYAVDFNDVSTVGLESSPVAAALAGLRAHEARYFKNKYDHVFTVEPASDAETTIDWSPNPEALWSSRSAAVSMTVPTTTSRSRLSSRNSCYVSERSTAGVPTTGHPCERSQVCVWIRSAARSTATAATSRSPASSSPSSKFSSLPKAASSAA